MENSDVISIMLPTLSSQRVKFTTDLEKEECVFGDFIYLSYNVISSAAIKC